MEMEMEMVSTSRRTDRIPSSSRRLPAVQAQRWTYDVFVSFRGETRNRFTDHLYVALRRAGINTFRDENELRRGEVIHSELLKAIENSRIAIVVFSSKYASSRWCLDELVKIMECRRIQRLLVLPIFYHVDNIDVRDQTGSFGEAFAECEARFRERDPDRLNRWRNALTEAANLPSVWDLSNTADGYEAIFNKQIVKMIEMELNHTFLHVAIHPVGLDARLQYVNFLLKIGSNDVRIIGISGLGGVGKTTIAKGVFNQLFHSFDGKSFLGSVRKASMQSTNSMVILQRQLLSDILKTKIEINNIYEGTNMIGERLLNKRVLIVIDDVDDIDQLNVLVGKREWFGFGTRIIITTRDEHLLKQIKVDRTYIVNEMNDNLALELLSWHAFRQRNPPEEFAEQSKSAIAYCKGLPLALEILGSYLSYRSIPEWNDTLEQLKGIPHDKIQQKLRISFDALDYTEQNIFLDIACFFVGVNKDYVTKILNDCGFFATVGIDVLLSLCLIKISVDDKILMHDLVQDMAKDIIQGEPKTEPEIRSRLWLKEDVLSVLNFYKGTESIQGLTLKLPCENEIHLKTESFKRLNGLRLLQLNYVQISGSFEHFSHDLKWLCWHGFPFKSLPEEFYQQNLVAIDLQYSNLNHVWQHTQALKKLKDLNLSYSHNLNRTPDFSMLPNLEMLKLKGCKSLEEIDESIGDLNKLVLMNVKDCVCLKTLPISIIKLKFLEILNLSGCLKIRTLPEDIGKMRSLTKLVLNKTAIRRIPFSVVCLEKLGYLSLYGCKGLSSSTSFSSLFRSWMSRKGIPESVDLMPTSVEGLSSLSTLCLENCSLSEDKLPKGLWNLPSLEDLNLRGNNFRSLPDSISSLPNLACLNLDNCSKLRLLPNDLPTTLEALYATECRSLEHLPDFSKFSHPPELYLNNCQKLVEIRGLNTTESGGLHLHGCKSLSQSFMKTLFEEWPGIVYSDVFLPGNEIPDLFNHTAVGSSLSFHVPDDVDFPFVGFTLCILYASNLKNKKTETVYAIPTIEVINKTTNRLWERRSSAYSIPIHHEDHLGIIHLPFNTFVKELNKGDEVEVVVDMVSELEEVSVTVKKCGVYLLFEEESKEGSISFYTNDSEPDQKGSSDTHESESTDEKHVNISKYAELSLVCSLKRWNHNDGDEGPSNAQCDEVQVCKRSKR